MKTPAGNDHPLTGKVLTNEKRQIPPARTPARELGILMLVVKLALGHEGLRRRADFRILEDFAFVIPDHNFVIVVLENIAGVNRDFAAAAWSVDHVLRYRITGGMPAQSVDDLDALGDGSTQMRRAVDQ